MYTQSFNAAHSCQERDQHGMNMSVPDFVDQTTQPLQVQFLQDFTDIIAAALVRTTHRRQIQGFEALYLLVPERLVTARFLIPTT